MPQQLTSYLIIACFLISMQWKTANSQENTETRQQQRIENLIADLDPKRVSYHYAWDAINILVSIGEPAVPALKAALRDRRRHTFAAMALRRFGPPSKEIIDDLIVMLNTGSSSARVSAAEFVSDAGENALPAVSALISCLNYKQKKNVLPSVSDTAIRALGEILPRGHRILDPLITRLDEGNRFVAKAIGQSEEGVVGLLKLRLRSSNLDVRHAAIDAFGYTDSENSVPLLVEALKNENQYTRSHAAGSLAHLGTKAANAMPALANAIEDNFDLVRGNAIEAIYRIGVVHPETIPNLIRGLGISGGMFNQVYEVAIEALVRIGKRAVPYLQQALSNENPLVQKNAFRALSRIGKDSSESLPVLIDFLSHEQLAVRQIAAKTIIAIGFANAEDLSKLRSLSRTKNEGISRIASDVLRVLEKPNSQQLSRIKILSEFDAVKLEGEDEHPNIRTLVQIGEPSVPFLIEAIKTSYRKPEWLGRERRELAAISLGKIRPSSNEIIKALILLLREDDKDGSAAITALADIGAPTLGLLIKALSHEHYQVRKQAVKALSNMKVPPIKAIETIQKLLTDRNKLVRNTAMLALWHLGETSLSIELAANVAKSKLSDRTLDDLRDNNLKRRYHAIRALRSRDILGEFVVDILISHLKDLRGEVPGNTVASESAKLLALHPHQAKRAIPQLLELLSYKEKYGYPAEGAEIALRSIGRTALEDYVIGLDAEQRHTITRSFIPVLESRAGSLRAWVLVAEVLGMLSPEASEAIPSLEAKLIRNKKEESSNVLLQYLRIRAETTIRIIKADWKVGSSNYYDEMKRADAKKSAQNLKYLLDNY